MLYICFQFINTVCCAVWNLRFTLLLMCRREFECNTNKDIKLCLYFIVKAPCSFKHLSLTNVKVTSQDTPNVQHKVR